MNNNKHNFYFFKKMKNTIKIYNLLYHNNNKQNFSYKNICKPYIQKILKICTKLCTKNIVYNNKQNFSYKNIYKTIYKKILKIYTKLYTKILFI